jgi:hypothetical protein
MLDQRSAGQLVGLLLIARVLAYGIVRLIETVKPRPIHFIITATVEQELKFLNDSKETEMTTGGCTSQIEGGEEPEFERTVWKSWRWSIRKYHYFIINVIRQRRGIKTKQRFTPKLLTEIFGLLAAGLSLIKLILECFFK